MQIKSKPKILLIEDELQWAKFLKYTIGEKFEVITLSDIEKVLSFLEKDDSIDVVLCDLMISRFRYKSKLPSTSLQLIEYIREIRPDLPIIAYSEYNVSKGDYNIGKMGFELLIDRTDMGSFDYLVKSINEVIRKSKIRPVEKSEKSSVFNEFRNLLDNEITSFVKIKEKTLSIPEEGNFELIKPLIGFKNDIENQLLKYSFHRNVFLMMKFRKENKDLSDFILETLKVNGLNGVRADQNNWNITKNVYNPIAALYCCKYGIALFDEPESHQAYSPNVAYELGIMHYQSKDCLILKHQSLPSVPFDLIKDLYVQYDKDLQLKNIISDWITQINFIK